MQIIKLSVLLLLMVLIAMANNTDLSLMPVPQKMTLEKGKFRLDDKFTLGVIGNTHPRAYGSASRMLHRLAGRTGMFFEQAYITAETEMQNPSMTITINKPGKVELYEDESYELRVAKDSISLNAETDIGALRGMETLLQLLDVDNEGYFFSAIVIAAKKPAAPPPIMITLFFIFVSHLYHKEH